jgi:hypothetical protein
MAATRNDKTLLGDAIETRASGHAAARHGTDAMRKRIRMRRRYAFLWCLVAVSFVGLIVYTGVLIWLRTSRP